LLKSNHIVTPNEFKSFVIFAVSQLANVLAKLAFLLALINLYLGLENIF